MPELLPDIETALIDYLPTATRLHWEGPGRPNIGGRLPAGVVERSGGGSGVELDQSVDVEITVYAKTRTGCWENARDIDRAMLRGLNPGGAAGVHVDECTQVFGWAIDPDRAGDDYRVATATYTLTARPQVDAESEEENNG